MIYIQTVFYLFVALLVLLYYVMPMRFRYIVLLIGSLAFYYVLASKSKRIFTFFILIALVSYVVGRLLSEWIPGKRNNTIRKGIFIASLAFITFPLLWYKEISYIISDYLKMSNTFFFPFIPLGISFYTLQIISYLIDIYTGKEVAEKNVFKYFLFISFFPQIVQGPIPRYNQLSGQLYEGHRFDERNITEGFMLIIWGFFLKMMIADKAGIIVDTIFDSFPEYQGMYVWVGGILFSLQLYTDFSACTTIAQGVSLLFGIELIDNFDHPYFSTTIKDFWRRWHISFSSWLKDYIYIPLGGNRKGTVRKYIYLIITFAVSGVWHGAGFKYVVWGLVHAIYQISGSMLIPVKKQVKNQAGLDDNSRMMKCLQMIITFFLVMIAWIIFRADSLTEGIRMIGSMFTVYNPWVLYNNQSLFSLGLQWQDWCVLLLSICLLVSISFKQENGVVIRKYILSQNLIVRWAIYIGGIVIIMIYGTYGFGYNSQDFIYGGF